MSTTYVSEGDTATPTNMNSWLNAAGGEVFNVKASAYGAVGDGVTDDRAGIVAADTAAAAASPNAAAIYFPPGTYVVSSSLTITSPVMFASGAKLQPAAGVAITLNGAINVHPIQHIFDITNSGSSVVCVEAAAAYYPTWWGAVGDGSTDDTAAIQAAIDAARVVANSTFGASVYFPAGTYMVSSQIQLRDRVTLAGSVIRGTLIRATSGFSDSYMFLASDADDPGTSMFGSVIQDVDIDCNNVAGLGAIVSDAWQENCGLRRVLIRNWRTNAVYIRDGFGGAANLKFEDIEFFGSTSGSTGGIVVDEISAAGGFTLTILHGTITGANGQHIPKAIDMAQDSLIAIGTHFEYVDTGIELDGVGRSIIVGASGSSTGPVTTVLEIASGFTGRVAALGVQKWSSTNSIVNNVTSETLTDDLAIYAYPSITGTSFTGEIPVVRTTASTELTIASGEISVVQTYHTVDTEADAASDDLDTINGGVEGQFLVIRAANSARTVVAKDGTGNLSLAGDFSLTNGEDTLTLLCRGADWVEISRSDNET